MNTNIPKRKFGRSTDEVSVLAVGGFHLIEALPTDVDKILNTYLDKGGNFIETAISYGDSEVKIGRTMKTRRNECFLSTKAHARDYKGMQESIDTSLKNLNTNYLDNLFVHNVSSNADVEQLLSENGGIKAAEEAKAAGKIRHLSISTHNPYVCLDALRRYKFDSVMVWINYYDKCNYPIIFRDLLNYCNETSTAIIGMKPLADGYLYRNPKDCIKWALSQPITAISSGMNSIEMLEGNIKIVSDFKPMTEKEEDKLLKDSKELGKYVCRQCDTCKITCKQNINVKRLFEIEGHYDRQMYDGNVPPNADYALRERLRFWFGNQDLAREMYNQLENKVPLDISEDDISGKCPYSIDILRKLKIAAWKLTGNNEYIN